MKPPVIFTLLGCTVEIAPGRRHAKVSRPEIRDGNTVIQSAASREFDILPGIDAPTPQIQAIRWIHSLPAVAAQAEPKIAEKPKDKK